MLRIFEVDTGRELTRAALDDSGLLSNLLHDPLGEGWSTRNQLPDLQESAVAAEAVLARSVEDVQYVATWGTLRCDELVPCVAARSGEEVLILRGQALYRIDQESEPLSFREDLQGERKEAVMRAAEERGELLVSLGGDRFATAQLIHEEP